MRVSPPPDVVAPKATTASTPADFASRMRRLRGDYGTCVECGEALTADDREGEKGAERHAGCERLGLCGGCYKPVRAREESCRVSPKKILVHDTEECRKKLEQREIADRERQEAAEKRRAARKKDRALQAAAIDWARSAEKLVLFAVYGDKAAESAAIEIRDYVQPKGEAYIASSRVGQKAIAFRASRGMVIVESVKGDVVRGLSGASSYTALCATTEASEKCADVLATVVESLGLPPEWLKYAENL